MARKRKQDVDASYDAKHYGADHNYLGSDERVIVQASVEALGRVKKRFEDWIAIGKGLALLRARADSIGTRKAFADLLTKNGLDELNERRMQPIVSNLIMIVRPDALDAVQSWHNGLPLHQQVRWASPSSIIRHAMDENGMRIFTARKPGADVPKQPRKPKTDTEAQARIEELEQEVANARAAVTGTAAERLEAVVPLLARMPWDEVKEVFNAFKEQVLTLQPTDDDKPVKKAKGKKKPAVLQEMENHLNATIFRKE